MSKDLFGSMIDDTDALNEGISKVHEEQLKVNGTVIQTGDNMADKGKMGTTGEVHDTTKKVGPDGKALPEAPATSSQKDAQKADGEDDIKKEGKDPGNTAVKEPATQTGTAMPDAKATKSQKIASEAKTVKEMKKYEIFKSEGGYRVCGGVWGDSPIIDASPWYASKEAAVDAAKNMRQKMSTSLKELEARIYKTSDMEKWDDLVDVKTVVIEPEGSSDVWRAYTKDGHDLVGTYKTSDMEKVFGKDWESAIVESKKEVKEEKEPVKKTVKVKGVEVQVGEDMTNKAGKTKTTDAAEVAPSEKVEDLKVKDEDVGKVKESNIFGLKAGQKLWECKVEDLVKVAETKGKAAVLRAMRNVERWNRKRSLAVSEKMAKLIESLRTNKAWMAVKIMECIPNSRRIELSSIALEVSKASIKEKRDPLKAVYERKDLLAEEKDFVFGRVVDIYEEEGVDADKELLGRKGDDSFYVLRNTSEDGVLQTVTVVDAAGDEKYTSEGREVDVNDETALYVDMIKELSIDFLSYDIFMNHFYPELVEEEEQDKKEDKEEKDEEKEEPKEEEKPEEKPEEKEEVTEEGRIPTIGDNEEGLIKSLLEKYGLAQGSK